MSPLVERFLVNAEAAGFVVHRGESPEIEGAERSTASYGLADTGSVVLAASPAEPRARHLLPDVHVSVLSETRILPGLEPARPGLALGHPRPVHGLEQRSGLAQSHYCSGG
jgi:LUD domain